jgi:hypothetical protein
MRTHESRPRGLTTSVTRARWNTLEALVRHTQALQGGGAPGAQLDR